ncbi:MAG: DALR domain-containing protein, partial [Candidatus Omnitrophota bacterium]
DFIEKYKDADLLKIFFLSAHYSHPVDYTNEKIEEAKKAYERINNLMLKLEQRYGDRKDFAGGGAGTMAHFKQQFDEYMDDDFNTPRALSVLFDMVSRCNVVIDSDDKDKNLKLNHAIDIIGEMTDILGLTFLKKSPTSISDDEITFQISARSVYKKQKNFKAADSIRKNLEEKGIILEDTKEGTTWRRKL